jgi:hypothetical protein
MTKKTDYFSFMSFCSVIFLGNSNSYAALRQPRNSLLRPTLVKIPIGDCYEVSKDFVEQRYKVGTIRWKKSMGSLSTAVVTKRPIKLCPPSIVPTEDKTRGIRSAVANKGPEKLEKALKKCRDPDMFIDCHPDLLLQFMAEYGHLDGIDEDYRKIINLLVEFGYREEECFLYPEEENAGHCRLNSLSQFMADYPELQDYFDRTGEDSRQAIDLLIKFGYRKKECFSYLEEEGSK